MSNSYGCILHYRQGSYKLIESDDQWQSLAMQHRGRSESENHQSGHPAGNPASGHNGQHGQQPHHASRKSGYMNSGAETETETHSQSSMKRNRRRQRYLCFSRRLNYYIFEVTSRSRLLNTVAGMEDKCFFFMLRRLVRGACHCHLLPQCVMHSTCHIQCVQFEKRQSNSNFPINLNNFVHDNDAQG